MINGIIILILLYTELGVTMKKKLTDQPSAPSTASTGHAELGAHPLQSVSFGGGPSRPIRLQQFSGEGPAAHPCTVRLDHANHLADGLRWQPEASARASHRCVGRRDEGIGACFEMN
jgi:hypothetical protein